MLFRRFLDGVGALWVVVATVGRGGVEGAHGVTDGTVGFHELLNELLG